MERICTECRSLRARYDATMGEIAQATSRIKESRKRPDLVIAQASLAVAMELRKEFGLALDRHRAEKHTKPE
jgi:hypothetical protein